MTASPPIYYISGDKGGVGKSITSMSLLDHLAQQGHSILFIETDTSNPDVWRCYEKTAAIESKLLLLDQADGWIALVNHCADFSDRVVVVNAAARSNIGLSAYGATLQGALPDLQRDLIALWVINRQRDSLELFRQFLKAFPTAQVHFIRNLYWGTEDKFELYNTSAIRTTIEERGGLTLNFPELADRVANNLFTDRLAIEQALKDLPIGNRAELRRWRNECEKIWLALEERYGSASHHARNAAVAA